MSEFAKIKMYLDGLIKRDCEALAPDDPYWQSDEYKQHKATQEARAKKIAAGDLRMLNLTEPGSIRMTLADRAETRRLMTEGWKFDNETTAWAKEGT